MTYRPPGPWTWISGFNYADWAECDKGFYSLRIPIAKKSHVCEVCGELIEKNEQYVTYHTKDREGPGWTRWKVHGECYLDPMASRELRPDWRWGSKEARRLRYGITDD